MNILWFADDIFGLKPRWVYELASEVELLLDAAVPFKMQSRVDFMTFYTVCALRRAGCAEVWMGAESRSPEDSVSHGQGDSGSIKSPWLAKTYAKKASGRATFSQFRISRGETGQDIQQTIAFGSVTHARRHRGFGPPILCPAPDFLIGCAPNSAIRRTGLIAKI